MRCTLSRCTGVEFTEIPAVRFEAFSACLEGCPRLLMFTGKGGVGKTTCAAAAAVALAGRGFETLLFSTDPAHSVSDSLGESIGPEIRPVPGVPRLWAVEIDAKATLNQFKHRFGDDLYDLVTSATYLDEEDAEALLELELPGLDEVMGLHQIFEFLSGDPSRFRHLVWDSAPTGHTLRLLELPALVDHWVRALAGITWKYRDLAFPSISAPEPGQGESDLLFMLKRTIRQFTAVTRDSARSRLIPVTTPEPMAGAETMRLVAHLQKDLHIPVQFAVLNGIHPLNPDCSFCTTRHRRTQASVQELAAGLRPLRLIALPSHPAPIQGVEQLRTLCLEPPAIV